MNYTVPRNIELGEWRIKSFVWDVDAWSRLPQFPGLSISKFIKKSF